MVQMTLLIEIALLTICGIVMVWVRRSSTAHVFDAPLTWVMVDRDATEWTAFVNLKCSTAIGITVLRRR